MKKLMPLVAVFWVPCLGLILLAIGITCMWGPPELAPCWSEEQPASEQSQLEADVAWLMERHREEDRQAVVTAYGGYAQSSAYADRWKRRHNPEAEKEFRDRAQKYLEEWSGLSQEYERRWRAKPMTEREQIGLMDLWKRETAGAK